MSTVLTLYSYRAFKRFLLPAINDANHSLLLSASLFNLERDIELKLEVIDYKWAFLKPEGCELRFQDESACYGSILRSGDMLKLYIKGKFLISILVRQTDQYFSVYEKYSLRDLSKPITIGKVSSSDISYDSPYLGINHGRIVYTTEGAYYENLDQENGSFVNHLRVDGSIPLEPGDCIDIYGLCIVFLGSVIAVNIHETGVSVKERYLQNIRVSAPSIQGGNRRPLTETIHRSPRHIPKIDSTPIIIEEVPQPKELDQPSMFMTIMPSLTMALPMILGCALMIYASNTSGFGGGLYLYTGLVTSVSAALIGTIWAVINLRQARKKHEMEENRRIQRYREYLLKKEEVINERYERNIQAMQERYRGADECCNYTFKSLELWNRNARQPDFLLERIGIGDVPFQAEIKVPEEKFTLIDDELAAIPRKLRDKYAMLHNVPVCIDLLEERIVGIFGGKNRQGAVEVALGLIAQIAANNSYTDVKLVLIYDEKKNGLTGSWDFIKWLPHVWNETRTFRYVASNREEASNVFYELTKKFRMIADNSEAAKASANKDYVPKPYYIIVLADTEALEGELISKYILDPDPIYGISTLYLTDSYENLPNECEFVIENSSSFQGVYRVTDDLEDRNYVDFDPISSSLLERLAGNLANIQIHEVESGGDVPSSLTFFEMYGVQKLSEFNVMERWRKNRTFDSMKALIGEKSGGAKCYLDIHEKYHGPHGLVAGTTGSGKSETLQTYILSLAINFSPDDIGFFIIDYKGGGMGNLFTDLPHMIGQISNLSGNQIHRALVSIKSEKDRRQRIFNEYGVNNINSYTKLYKNREAKLPVPHLFIIIDEFAEMKRDEPAFIQELVSVSQVGRSLGIHLIMATQKPAGTVDDNIWSNSRFKLCLRVQDRQDSIDMLHRADAAYIIQAGRCYLQVGNDELFELFQSGWSGAPYSEDSADLETDVAKLLSLDGVAALEGNKAKLERKKEKRRLWIQSLVGIIKKTLKEEGAEHPHYELSDEERDRLFAGVFRSLAAEKVDFPRNEYNEKSLSFLISLMQRVGDDPKTIIETADDGTGKLPEPAEKTQLDAVVGYLKNLASENGYDYDFRLFLPLLSDTIYLRGLPQRTCPFNADTAYNGSRWPIHKGALSLAVSMGIYDDPENQNQDTYVLDLAKTGNIALCGAISTGKSTFLQTFIFGLTNRYSPEEVQIYAIDFSAKMLSVFEQAPHVGGMMYEDDLERIAKFFTLISRILDRRKKELKGGSFEQYIAVNGNGSLPAIVIIIDNYSAFLAKGGITEPMEDFLLQISKEGVSYGIFLVVTAAGFGSGELPVRMAENFRTTISLEMNDIMLYGEILRKIHLDVYPEPDTKGRGITLVNGRILEFQTALAFPAESDYDRGNKISSISESMNHCWKGNRPRPIPEIPDKPVWSIFEELDDYKDMVQSPDRLPLGYDAVSADVYGPDLSRIYTYIISGAKRKGKTNAMKALIRSAVAKNARTVVIDYSAGLKRFSENEGAEFLETEVDFYNFLADFQSDFESRNIRKRELSDMDLEEREIFDRMQEFEKVCIFIDNLPGFIEKAYDIKEDESLVGDYTELLEVMWDRGALHNVYWFGTINKKEAGTADVYRLYDLFVRDKKGVHLGGMTDDSPMNFENLDYRIRDKVLAAGRGLLPVDNEERVEEIVIPLVKGTGK
ncbi:MAG: FHA domain-containing protein [Lachnospiraceae bacterium]|nr:FHA domain-containing protein [Lachnospiraceae bacterium]